MEPIQSIADIPFLVGDPFELLHLDEHRDETDFSYYGFGFCRIGQLQLNQRGETEPSAPVRDCLVLALHAADDCEQLDDDVELEFFVDEVAEDYSVTVLLSDFLKIWLPRLLGGEQALVLSLCNPHKAVLRKPAICGSTPVYYPLGDVESWLESIAGRPLIGLDADEWRLAE
ncbi:MAG: hypothetical protein AAGC55_34705 [Myxococcota bacterium]